jgi:hypothetical protein
MAQKTGEGVIGSEIEEGDWKVTGVLSVTLISTAGGKPEPDAVMPPLARVRFGSWSANAYPDLV